MKTKNIAFLALMTVDTGACQQTETPEPEPKRQPDQSYNPVIAPANFTNGTRITNAYYPFEPGKTYVYEGPTGDGLERIEVRLLPVTRVILGVTCAEVSDKVWLAGKLVEDTRDWYAQDNGGDLWYMGEYVTALNPDGSVKDHAGSWEAGVDGAKPGYQMLANPQVGKKYRQEYRFDVAEDAAEIVETGLTVTVPFGTFSNCVKIKEYSEIIPDFLEYKYYAPGVGLIKSVNAVDNEEVVLIAIQ